MSGMFAENVDRLKHKSVEWYTPAWIFEELGISFDLDPSSPHDHESQVPATIKYTVYDDGLSKKWIGRVWLNPPYGPDTTFWIQRLIEHGDGIALVFSRTDTVWFQNAFKAATSILFLVGRIDFIPGHENKHKTSHCGAGSVMLAFGEECGTALKNMASHGSYIELSESKKTETQQQAMNFI